MTALLNPFKYRPSEGAVETPDWKTLQVDGPPGLPQVRETRPTPIWTVPYNWLLDPTTGFELLSLLRALRGPAVPVYLYSAAYLSAWVDVAFGTGDGSTAAFALGTAGWTPLWPNAFRRCEMLAMLGPEALLGLASSNAWPPSRVPAPGSAAAPAPVRRKIPLAWRPD